MVSDKIKIAGKECGAAYCYATEIAFHNYTGIGIDNLDPENPEHIVYLIIAAVFAYYQGSSEELPIVDSDVMLKASPTEIKDAVIAISKLRVEWYKLPEGEQPDEVKEEDGEKN